MAIASHAPRVIIARAAAPTMRPLHARRVRIIDTQGKVAVWIVEAFQAAIMVRGVRRMVPRVRLMNHVPWVIIVQTA